MPLLDDSHVAMSVNLDACIQCGLCVRACREVQVNDVIGMAGAGTAIQIVFDMDDPMGPHLRGLWRMCAGLPDRRADAATVVDDAQQGDSADYDEESKASARICGVGCQVSFKSKDEKMQFVEGINGPANEGRLCVKGRFGFDYITTTIA